MGNGCSESSYLSGDPNALNYYCLGVPNKEFRLALARPFLDGRLNVGVNMMIATGWTGQTTENFACAIYGSATCPNPNGNPPIAIYAPGAVGLVNGLVPGNPVNEVVGVRIPSYASVGLIYRFARSVTP